MKLNTTNVTCFNLRRDYVLKCAIPACLRARQNLYPFVSYNTVIGYNTAIGYDTAIAPRWNMFVIFVDDNNTIGVNTAIGYDTTIAPRWNMLML